jgi:beta-lactamase class A
MKQFLFSVLIVVATPLIAQTDPWTLLSTKTEKTLREITEQARGIVGVVAVDLTSGEHFGVNTDLLFPQASAIKVPVLMEVFKQANEGKLRLADLHWLTRSYKVGGSGVLQEFGDSTSRLSVYDLCVLMIVLSDNTAANLLIDLVGMENVNGTMASLGLKQTRLQRKMLDTAASARGEENLSTPAEAARIMELLYRGKFVSRTTCDEILSILKKPKEGTIASVLPEGTPVAFKPGDLAGVETEWALVYLRERPYIVVFMENYELEQEGKPIMKRVSRLLYEFFWRRGRATIYGTYR